MNRTARLYRLRSLLGKHHVVSAQDLMEKLGVSRSSLTRYLHELEETLAVPVYFDREAGGYRLAADNKRELAGLWFSPEEIHALLTMQHLLTTLDSGGLLGPHIAPLQQRLTQLLGTADDSAQEIARRVFIETVGARRVRSEHFQTVGSALLRRVRLRIEYHSRGTNQTRTREVSPQRLVHYRDNWYLDAWCHHKEALRRFALDSILQAEALPATALDLDQTSLESALDKGYGIFAGAQVQWAVLRFSAERSRWVAQERWHPDQQGHPLPDGRYELRLPYAESTELIMDILKHGRHVTVVAPPELAAAVRQEHLLAAQT